MARKAGRTHPFRQWSGARKATWMANYREPRAYTHTKWDGDGWNAGKEGRGEDPKVVSSQHPSDDVDAVLFSKLPRPSGHSKEHSPRNYHFERSGLEDTYDGRDTHVSSSVSLLYPTLHRTNSTAGSRRNARWLIHIVSTTPTSLSLESTGSLFHLSLTGASCEIFKKISELGPIIVTVIEFHALKHS